MLLPSLPDWDGLHPLVVHFPIALLLVAPVVGPGDARAEAAPAVADLGVPKPIRDWIKKNALGLYIVFDEIMDDVFGSGHTLPPPPPPQPEEPPPYVPY